MSEEKVTITPGDVGVLDVTPRKATHADRLAAVLLKALPHLKEQIESGEWGPKGAPYFFRTLGDGRMGLVIKNAETEEQIGVVGTSREDLISQMEARLSAGGQG